MQEAVCCCLRLKLLILLQNCGKAICNFSLCADVVYIGLACNFSLMIHVFNLSFLISFFSCPLPFVSLYLALYCSYSPAAYISSFTQKVLRVYTVVSVCFGLSFKISDCQFAQGPKGVLNLNIVRLDHPTIHLSIFSHSKYGPVKAYTGCFTTLGHNCRR